MTFEVNAPTAALLNTAAGMANQVDLFNQNRTGFLATSGGDYIAWYKFTPDIIANFSQATQDHIANFPNDWPEVEYVINSNAASIGTSSSTKNEVTIGTLLIKTK